MQKPYVLWLICVGLMLVTPSVHAADLFDVTANSNVWSCVGGNDCTSGYRGYGAGVDYFHLFEPNANLRVGPGGRLSYDTVSFRISDTSFTQTSIGLYLGGMGEVRITSEFGLYLSLERTFNSLNVISSKLSGIYPSKTKDERISFDSTAKGTENCTEARLGVLYEFPTGTAVNFNMILSSNHYSVMKSSTHSNPSSDSYSYSYSPFVSFAIGIGMLTGSGPTYSPAKKPAPSRSKNSQTQKNRQSQR